MSLQDWLKQRTGKNLVFPPHSRFVLVFLSVILLSIWYVWSAKAAVTITVNTTSDFDGSDGFCSLREAIIATNTNAPRYECFHDGSSGIDTIAFNILGPTPHIISPNAPMTNIIAPVIIDGASEPDYLGTPVVVLDGSFAGTTDGLVVDLGDTTIRGLAVVGFVLNGINLVGGSNYTIELNHIGVDHSGTVAAANLIDGIFVSLSVTDVTIQNNLISGNVGNGVFLNGNLITNVVIRGNYIGTDITGTADLGNGFDGVQIRDGFNNRIGGSSVLDLNIISGNGRYGVYINGSQAANNRVEGNIIGADVSGDSFIPNTSGVGIESGHDNRVGDGSGGILGGFCDGGCNLISGNSVNGVEIFGLGAVNNVIEANYIGSDISGTADLGNGVNGIAIFDTSNNHIGGITAQAMNLISGNDTNGVWIWGGSSIQNKIEGNIIGLDISGTAVLGNSLDGVVIDQGDTNSIGGNISGVQNVIAGNGRYGIYLVNDANSNVISGNLIGSNISGTADLGNGDHGIFIQDGTNNLVGGITTVERNLISGNNANGIFISGPAAFPASNQIVGNYIGTNITGTAVISNTYYGIDIFISTNNLIGGITSGAGNLISGNNFGGINLSNNSNNTQIQGNYIGTDAFGSDILPNNYTGISIFSSDYNVIGGIDPNANNLISGNNGQGILVSYSNHNVIQGNFIGTDVTGTAALGNLGTGITVSNGFTNTIGAPVPGAGNLISSNQGGGISLQAIIDLRQLADGNVVEGNYIGTDVTGQAALGNNFYGVEIYGGNYNRIGGATTGAGNIISGNLGDGIYITMASGNLVEGNYIGTNASGTAALGNNNNGVHIVDADNNRIGGTATGTGNIISGNGSSGIRLLGIDYAFDNFIQGNSIGTDATGTTAVPNGAEGIIIEGAITNNTIVGGTVPQARNIISGNNLTGVTISNGAAFNYIQGNYIGTDSSGTNALGNGSYGVGVIGAFNNQIGGGSNAEQNLISGNNNEGVAILGNSLSNFIGSNFIGTDINGNTAIGNGSSGISIFSGSSSNTIFANLISGNANHGVDIAFSYPAANVVEQNLIGVDASGTAVLPNGASGVVLNHDANSNTILNNVISGNSSKGVVLSNRAYGNVLQGNAIGTDVGGSLNLGNGDIGVSISLSATNNLIGGSLGNIIAYNNGPGVTVTDLETEGNAIRANRIYQNGELGIDLNNDGITPNDIGDGDFGPNFLQNYPILFRAVPNSGETVIQGRLDGWPKTFYDIDFYLNSSCDDNNYGEGEMYLGSQTIGGLFSSISFSYTIGSALPYGYFVTAVASDAYSNTSEFSRCVSVGPGNDTWVTASDTPLARVPLTTTVITQTIDAPDQSRWFKFAVDPSSNITITLSNLPTNYDLTVYKDIEAAFQEEISSTEDLLLLSAEFAPDIFNPDIFNPDIFNPDIFNPDIFNPDIFNPDIFNPDIFNPDIFNPDIFNPDIFNPDAYNPDIFNPDIFNPDIFNPDIFNPDIFNDAFSNAQLRSVVAGSGREGLADEFVKVNTWNNDGYYYVRVRGRNGAYDSTTPFTLTVEMSNNVCLGVTTDLPATSLTAVSADYHTLILVDWAELALTNDPATLVTLQQRLDELAARPEVAGVVIDVGQDERVQAARQQANDLIPCPQAKNILADSVKAIIDLYWVSNPDLEYIVLTGNDAVIPFYRHPDQGLLAPESNYIVPVFTNTSSYASLALNYLLSQDAYGARRDISTKSSELPIPELAVGRLVEDASDMITVLDAYLSTSDGVVVPGTSLVTGYDFLEDAANAVLGELDAGIGTAPDTLISPQSISPAEGWTADDLRAALLANGRHDIVYMAGHFSAGGALAADYTTRMLAAEVTASNIDMLNTLIFSAGCHSGYNVVTPDGVPGITAEPDWAEAFAEKGATLVAGTGYQYGDSDFLEYGERLYWLYSQQLRTGSGAVSVGQALVAAKQEYLVDTGDETNGLYQKQMLIATLFGLPMLRVDMPGERINPSSGGSIVTGTSGYTAPGPGLTLGLEYADVTIFPDLTLHTMELVNMNNITETITVSYLSGGGPAQTVSVSPAEPVLPLESYNVNVPGLLLRGVGFLGGSYSSNSGIRPLAGAATFDLTGPRPIFTSDYFYPTKLWDINYLGAIINPTNGSTNLIVTPAQFQSDTTSSPTGYLRQYEDMAFRLFYSNNLNTYSGNTPALSNPPTISNVYAEVISDTLTFRVKVIGDPAAGVQAVWVTWTDGTAVSGQWQSFDLVQDNLDSTLWEGVLSNLGSIDPNNVNYMVQAVNGVGMVSLNTNLGQFYQPGIDPGEPAPITAVPSTLTLDTPITTGSYGDKIPFSATLTGEGGVPVSGVLVTFNLGAQRTAVTDSEGRATVLLPLSLSPGNYTLQVSFAGTAEYQPSTASSPFAVTKQTTALTLIQESLVFTATLQNGNGDSLIQKPLIFIVEGSNSSFTVATITNYLGQAVLQLDADLPDDLYTITVYFGQAVTLPDATLIDLTDNSYVGAETSNILIIGQGAYLYLPIVVKP